MCDYNCSILPCIHTQNIKKESIFKSSKDEDTEECDNNEVNIDTKTVNAKSMSEDNNTYGDTSEYSNINDETCFNNDFDISDFNNTSIDTNTYTNATHNTLSDVKVVEINKESQNINDRTETKLLSFKKEGSNSYLLRDKNVSISNTFNYLFNNDYGDLSELNKITGNNIYYYKKLSLNILNYNHEKKLEQYDDDITFGTRTMLFHQQRPELYETLFRTNSCDSVFLKRIKVTNITNNLREKSIKKYEIPFEPNFYSNRYFFSDKNIIDECRAIKDSCTNDCNLPYSRNQKVNSNVSLDNSNINKKEKKILKNYLNYTYKLQFDGPPPHFCIVRYNEITKKTNVVKKVPVNKNISFNIAKYIAEKYLQNLTKFMQNKEKKLNRKKSNDINNETLNVESNNDTISVYNNEINSDTIQNTNNMKGIKCESNNDVTVNTSNMDVDGISNNNESKCFIDNEKSNNKTVINEEHDNNSCNDNCIDSGDNNEKNDQINECNNTNNIFVNSNTVCDNLKNDSTVVGNDNELNYEDNSDCIYDEKICKNEYLNINLDNILFNTKTETYIKYLNNIKIYVLRKADDIPNTPITDKDLFDKKLVIIVKIKYDTYIKSKTFIFTNLPNILNECFLHYTNDMYEKGGENVNSSNSSNIDNTLSNNNNYSNVKIKRENCNSCETDLTNDLLINENDYVDLCTDSIKKSNSVDRESSVCLHNNRYGNIYTTKNRLQDMGTSENDVKIEKENDNGDNMMNSIRNDVTNNYFSETVNVEKGEHTLDINSNIQLTMEKEEGNNYCLNCNLNNKDGYKNTHIIDNTMNKQKRESVVMDYKRKIIKFIRDNVYINSYLYECFENMYKNRNFFKKDVIMIDASSDSIDLVYNVPNYINELNKFIFIKFINFEEYIKKNSKIAENYVQHLLQSNLKCINGYMIGLRWVPEYFAYEYYVCKIIEGSAKDAYYNNDPRSNYSLALQIGSNEKSVKYLVDYENKIINNVFCVLHEYYHASLFTEKCIYNLFKLVLLRVSKYIDVHHMQVVTLDLDKAIYRIKKFSEPISYYDCTQSEYDNNSMKCENVRKHTYSSNNMHGGTSTTSNTTDNEQNLGKDKDGNTFDNNNNNNNNNNNDISNSLSTGYNDIYNNQNIKTKESIKESIKTVDNYNVVDVVGNSNGTLMIKDENNLQENALFSNKNINTEYVKNNDYDVLYANKMNSASYSDENTTNKQSYVKKIAHHELFNKARVDRNIKDFTKNKLKTKKKVSYNLDNTSISLKKKRKENSRLGFKQGVYDEYSVKYFSSSEENKFRNIKHEKIKHNYASSSDTSSIFNLESTHKYHLRSNNAQTMDNYSSEGYNTRGKINLKNSDKSHIYDGLMNEKGIVEPFWWYFYNMYENTTLKEGNDTFKPDCNGVDNKNKNSSNSINKSNKMHVVKLNVKTKKKSVSKKKKDKKNGSKQNSNNNTIGKDKKKKMKKNIKKRNMNNNDIVTEKNNIIEMIRKRKENALYKKVLLRKYKDNLLNFFYKKKDNIKIKYISMVHNLIYKKFVLLNNTIFPKTLHESDILYTLFPYELHTFMFLFMQDNGQYQNELFLKHVTFNDYLTTLDNKFNNINDNSINNSINNNSINNNSINNNSINNNSINNNSINNN
ncbi:AP2 domain transcription factor, putative, partial [Hepatocystis sp. ex Piliocolobus tephrosceles]